MQAFLQDEFWPQHLINGSADMDAFCLEAGFLLGLEIGRNRALLDRCRTYRNAENFVFLYMSFSRCVLNRDGSPDGESHRGE